ncbi:hypothetical protein C1H76_9303 [Elsinoe australis]|uniref:Uncharacterized protein n=1 Tax=Elsinoe australis TaxID=40998 RepID=A0A4U7ASJ0_9PEZI|nr:hypothetical protein C1H76_9303 [Elsinoe australis]
MSALSKPSPKGAPYHPVRAASNIRIPAKGIKRSISGMKESSSARKRRGPIAKSREPPHHLTEEIKETTQQYIDHVAISSESALNDIFKVLSDDLDKCVLQTADGKRLTTLEHCSTLQLGLEKSTASLENIIVGAIQQPDNGNGRLTTLSLGTAMQNFKTIVSEKRENLEALMTEYNRVHEDINTLYQELMLSVTGTSGSDEAGPISVLQTQLDQSTTELRKNISNLAAEGIAAVERQEARERKYDAEISKIFQAAEALV